MRVAGGAVVHTQTQQASTNWERINSFLKIQDHFGFANYFLVLGYNDVSKTKEKSDFKDQKRNIICPKIM